MLLSGTFIYFSTWVACVVGFFAWGIMASSAYLLNDLRDLESDRDHWSKRDRPIARGDLTVSRAVTVAVIGVAVSLAIGWTLAFGAFVVLVAYLLSTTAYSLWLERELVIDVLVLASLYTLRLVFGIELAGVVPCLGYWCSPCSCSLSLSLPPSDPRRSAAAACMAARRP